MSKKVTIKDVSKRADVAIATVSNALNPNSNKISPEKRKHVLNVIKEMNYVPDVRGQALSSRRKKRIGFFINNSELEFESENNINTQIIYYLNFFAFKKDIEIINIFSFGDQDSCSSMIAKINAYNLSDIIVFGLSIDDGLLKEIRKLSINKAFIDIPFSDKNSFFVSTNNYKAQYELLKVSYQIKNFNNLIYIGGDENSYVGIERLRAVKSFCTDFKVNLEYKMGEFNRQTGYKNISDYLILDHVIACGCDLISLGVVDYLKENNLKNLVLGFDGLKIMQYAYENFRTVVQDIELMSKTIITKISKNDIISEQISYEIR